MYSISSPYIYSGVIYPFSYSVCRGNREGHLLDLDEEAFFFVGPQRNSEVLQGVTPSKPSIYCFPASYMYDHNVYQLVVLFLQVSS